jgi:orotate phosphoribosyltransferase
MYPNGSNGVSQGVLDAMTFADLMTEGDSVINTLQKYEDARREVTSKIVLANRETGPEKVMQMVHETCDGSCGPVHSCVEHDTLKEVANSYKKLAGFHAGTLNKQE